MATEQWHLDKRVPIARIVTIIVQTVGGGGAIVWWAAGMSQRVGQIERQMENAAARSQNVDNLVASQATQIAVLVERIEAQNERVVNLTAQVAQTNDLLREYLRRNGGTE